VRNDLAGLDIRQAFVDAGQEADTLFDVLPSRRVREFLDRFDSHVFARHAISIPQPSQPRKQIAGGSSGSLRSMI